MLIRLEFPHHFRHRLTSHCHPLAATSHMVRENLSLCNSKLHLSLLSQPYRCLSSIRWLLVELNTRFECFVLNILFKTYQQLGDILYEISLDLCSLDTCKNLDHSLQLLECEDTSYDGHCEWERFEGSEWLHCDVCWVLFVCPRKSQLIYCSM